MEAQGGVLIPFSILIVIIGWLIVDRIKAQQKKDVEQDTKIEKLIDAVAKINELLYKHQKDIEWITKSGNGLQIRKDLSPD